MSVESSKSFSPETVESKKLLAPSEFLTQIYSEIEKDVVGKGQSAEEFFLNFDKQDVEEWNKENVGRELPILQRGPAKLHKGFIAQVGDLYVAGAIVEDGNAHRRIGEVNRVQFGVIPSRLWESLDNLEKRIECLRQSEEGKLESGNDSPMIQTVPSSVSDLRTIVEYDPHSEYKIELYLNREFTGGSHIFSNLNSHVRVDVLPVLDEVNRGGGKAKEGHVLQVAETLQKMVSDIQEDISLNG